MEIQKQMFEELQSKETFEKARTYAYDYIDGIEKMKVFPSEESLKLLQNFEEKMPLNSSSALNILKQLNEFGSPNTTAQTGGRYFGFVDGGAVPVSLGVKWLSDVWDQCGGLYLISPINSKLEEICEAWLKDIFSLPDETVAGFVSGTTLANLCGIAAARFHILDKLGWNAPEQGLNGAPKIRIIAHDQTHASVKKILSILGLGTKTVEWIPTDNQGRIIVNKMPSLDATCIVLLQAGNVNTGAFDDFDAICDLANEAGAWTHIDGAFGLWAEACKNLKHHTNGMQKASSWAVDGHKTLNTPYDSGVILCKHPKAMISALHASGEYIKLTDHKEPFLFGPEMSKRSRAIEMWATLKYLGKSGIDEMVTTFHSRAKQLAKGLDEIGFEILNEVVFNQVLVSTDNEEKTRQVIKYIQNSGECWVGGSLWDNKAVIRVSICSWATTENDIERTIDIFKKAKTAVE